MIGLMLAAAAAAAPAPPVIVEGSRGWVNDRHALQAAFAAPLHPRRPGEPRFCFDDAISRVGDVRRVCRSRRAWNRLGFDPVAPLPAQLANN